MRVGSLVELVNDNWDSYDFQYGEARPIKGEVYTIRTLESTRLGKAVRLEEIVNRKHVYVHFGKPVKEEIAFSALRFRELQEPIDLEAVMSNEDELVKTN